MGIVVDKGTRVVVQGATGVQGRIHTKLMIDYGTKIVAGVTPGRGGTRTYGVPIYNTVEEAASKHDLNTSILFVPASSVEDAAIEAIKVGLKTLVIITERTSSADAGRINAYAKRHNVTIIGPNTPGIITPNSCKVGIMPVSVFKKGNIGVVSRSGTLSYEVAAGLITKQLGISTSIGIGGDSIIGLSFVDVLRLFEKDDDTHAVVLIGEIGGDFEERAAEFIATEEYSKPVVAYVAGGMIHGTLPPEVRMGHAGAIFWGETGTAENKVKTFRKYGVAIAEKVSEVPNLVQRLTTQRAH